MSAIPAARYLVDFAAGGADSALRPEGGHTSASNGAAVAAKVDEAFALGLERGRAETQTQYEARLAQQQNELAARLVADRQQWSATTGEELADRLVAAIADLEKRVAETTARILRPFLAAELHRQTIAELQSSLETLLATGSDTSIHISGPADVLDALRARLASSGKSVVYSPGAGCDVRVVAGQATLETQLASWQAKLDEAMR
jgi:hypothetical protein